MPTTAVLSRRLVLSYDKGSRFTFRHFIATATDAQLYDIAMRLNAFQVCNVEKVFSERVIEF
ncbi:MAG: DUF1659 domain-containing protein [Defluviitaleaceae bacterium]|nr:DUF1659 domain-containing protein [Defluviitaleaceae bacterium]